MIKHLNIRQRILITFIAIVLIGSILQLVIAGRQLQLATLEFYQHHLETDALTVASTLSEPLEHYLEGEGTTSIQRLLAGFQQSSGYYYLIVDRDYRIVGYSADAGYETLDRMPATPELTQAGDGRIGADIRPDFEGNERLYVAVEIAYEQHPLGYLVLSRPMQPAYLEVYQQWLQLSSASLPVIALVIAAGLWLSGTISRPVQQLRNSALRMAGGALDTRINTDSQDEVGQLAHAFNYMAEKIEALMKTQRSFVSNAAHELRTPLMTFKLHVEALEDNTLPSAERAANLAELHREINHMTALVGSLLVLARIDEGRQHPNGGVTDTSSALNDIARRWRIEARQSNLEFEADIPAELPGIPLTPDDLRLVLDNLLGNAVKYTQHGNIRFSVQHSGEQVIMKISDTGTGFEPDLAERLFMRFYRSDTARARFEGNGLGLSIVEAVLEQYGCSVSAESQGVTTGATFTVRIPLVSQTAPNQLHQPRH